MVRLTAVAAGIVALSAAVSTPRYPADEAGMVVSADRRAVLMVRRGATPSMRLRIVARREEIPAGAAIVAGSYYEIVPHDVTLRKSAHFRISYRPGTLPDGVAEENLTLLHYVDGAWTEVPNATLNAAKNSVAANVRRLGGYAVGVVTPLQSASESLSQS